MASPLGEVRRTEEMSRSTPEAVVPEATVKVVLPWRSGDNGTPLMVAVVVEGQGVQSGTAAEEIEVAAGIAGDRSRRSG